MITIESADFRKSKVKTFENRKSRVSESENQDFRKSKSNNTYINNTDISDTEYSNTDFNNHILSYPISDEELNDDGSDEPLDAIGWMRERTTYENLIKDNIDYDIMIEKFEKAWIDEIVELMVDVVRIVKLFCVLISDIRCFNRNRCISWCFLLW